MLCELADAAIGTAHSTLMEPGQSFTSIDLKAAFLRPVWRSRLCARAWAEHRGRTISHYRCEIERSEEHTSELQSPCNLVCRLLLEKKKTCQPRSSTQRKLCASHAPVCRGSCAQTTTHL